MAQTLQDYRESPFFDQYLELLNAVGLQDEEVQKALFATVVQRSVIPYMNLLLQIKQEIAKTGEEMQTTFAFVEHQAEAIQSSLKDMLAGHDELSTL